MLVFNLIIPKVPLPALGFRLNGQEANAVLTRGPISNSDAGKAFRLFWGAKSELRRIDGDLYECVIWSTKSNVLKQIVDHVLHSHFNLLRDASSRWTWNQITPDCLQALLSTSSACSNTDVTTVSSVRLVRAMDSLRALLRGLNKKLPLNVTAVMPISSVMRETAVFHPHLIVPSASGSCSLRRKFKSSVTHGVKTPVFPIYVVITLEQSGKWPDALVPFMQMKRLLLIRINDLLAPMGIPSHVTNDNMLDIFMDGLVFRISLAQPRELRLLQGPQEDLGTEDQSDDPMISTKQVARSMSTKIPQTAESLAWIRLNQSLPMISGLLASVARGEAQVFPAACRLAKRWLSAHGYPVVMCPFESELDGLRSLVYDKAVSTSIDTTQKKLTSFSIDEWTNQVAGGRMTEIAVELLVVYAAGYGGSVERSQSDLDGPVQDTCRIRPSAVNSPVAAFLRFLKLLATHDWEKKPLLVELNEGFGDITKRREALSSMDGNRNRLPAMVICTPVDTQGVEWTTVGPTRGGLKKLQRLAIQSRKLLRAMLVAGAHLKELKAIFRPVPDNHDVVLTLKPEILNVRAAEAVDYVDKSLKSSEPQVESSLDEIPPPGARFWPIGYCYDPSAYFVQLLRSRLGRHCEIFWDRHGGDWIGLNWRLAVCDPNGPGPFQRDSLDGLVKHTEAATTPQETQMRLMHRLYTLTDVLPSWAKAYAHSIRCFPRELSEPPAVISKESSIEVCSGEAEIKTMKKNELKKSARAVIYKEPGVEMRSGNAKIKKKSKDSVKKSSSTVTFNESVEICSDKAKATKKNKDGVEARMDIKVTKKKSSLKKSSPMVTFKESGAKITNNDKDEINKLPAKKRRKVSLEQ